jgi:hypothetical protein
MLTYTMERKSHKLHQTPMMNYFNYKFLPLLIIKPHRETRPEDENAKAAKAPLPSFSSSIQMPPQTPGKTRTLNPTNMDKRKP